MRRLIDQEVSRLKLEVTKLGNQFMKRFENHQVMRLRDLLMKKL